MAEKKVFIVVLNWNGKKDTLECLKSLGEISYGNYKIIVSDNDSKDSSTRDIKKQFPRVEMIENKENLGFAGGNNVGIKYAMENGADYVLLLNNDTTVEKNFLKELVEMGEKKKEAGLLGAKIFYYDRPRTIWFAGGKINWLKNKGTHIGLNETDCGQYKKTREVDYLTGCCLLIKREVVEKIGYLSEEYFLYYEDTDFCLRVRNIGYQCLFVPKAKVYHKVSRSAKAGSPSYIYYHTRNGLIMAKKNGSFLNKIALYPYCLFLFLKQIVKIILLPQKRSWALAVLKGKKDFLLGKTGKGLSFRL